MEVIGEDDDGIDFKWMHISDLAHGTTQAFYMFHKQAPLAFGKVNGKEKNTAGVFDAPVLHSGNCRLYRRSEP